MKIHSTDTKSWLEIKAHSDEFGHQSVMVEVSVDISHGIFNAKNTDLNFQNIDEFISQLDQFILDRTIAPRLNGTYDSIIELYGNTSHIFLRFRIGDTFCGRKTHNYNLHGSFEIDQDQLLSIKEAVQNIFGR